MRKKNQKQLPLMIKGIDHPHVVKLEEISQILDDNPIINEWVLQDLTRDVMRTDTGAEGMSAEQVVRAAIVKQMEGYSYDDLAFHLLDSVCYRRFCRIRIVDKGFQKSALCNNIKAISPETWGAINHSLTKEEYDRVFFHAEDLGFERLFVQFLDQTPAVKPRVAPFVPDFRQEQLFL